MSENEQPSAKNEVEADYRIVKPEEKAPAIHTYRSLMRLLVGGAIEGGDELMRRVQAWEEAHQPEDTGAAAAADERALQRARYALIGLLYEAPATALQRALPLYETSERVGGVVGNLVGPVARSRLMSPVRKRLQRVEARAGLAVERWIEIGRVQEPYGRALARDLISQIIDDVVAQLAENEEVEDLIHSQGDAYIAYLSEHPELIDDLVQKAGDKYIHYLRVENPNDVQELITDQTMGITSEVADEVRERTVTADSLVEMVFRSLLRRPPRADLPPPPPEVIEQAMVTRLDVRQEFVRDRFGEESGGDDAQG